jgi:hypothetical protein
MDVLCAFRVATFVLFCLRSNAKSSTSLEVRGTGGQSSDGGRIEEGSTASGRRSLAGAGARDAAAQHRMRRGARHDTRRAAARVSG